MPGPLLAAALAAAAIAAAIPAAGLLLPLAGPGPFWLLARAPPVAWAASLLLAGGRGKPGAVEACARYCSRGAAERGVLGWVDARGSCPGPGVLRAAVERRLGALAVGLLRRGCPWPSGPARSAVEVLAAFAGLLPPGPGAVVKWCGAGDAALMLDGRVYLASSLPEGLRGEALRLARVDTYAGRAPSLSAGCGPGSALVTLEDLAVDALPESPPGLEGLLWSLGLDPPEEPAGWPQSVARAARRLAWLALRVPEEARSWRAKLARDYLGAEPVECPREPRLTDAPRPACPYYSPYALEPPRDGDPPRLRYILESLRARGGNPVRAALELERRGLRVLAEAVLSRARPRPAPARGPLQVEPWYAGCAAPREPVVGPCARPVYDCLNWEGPGPVEEELAARGLEPPSLACPAPQGLFPRRAAEARGPAARPRGVALQPGGDPLGEIVEAVRRLAASEGGPGLVVTPGPLLAEVLEPLLPEGWEAVSWGLVELEPWRLLRAGKALLVLPERFPLPRWLARLAGDPPRLLEASRERLSELAGRPGVYVATRGLPALGLEPRPPEDRGAPPRRGPSGPGLPGPGSVRREARRVFRRHWGPGLSLRPYQELVIDAIVRGLRPAPGRPVLGIFPTGSGKSAMFQVAGVLVSRLVGGSVLVVSPLRALIRDQVEALARRGFAAARLDSSVPWRSRRAAVTLYAAGVLDFLYATPERFQDPLFSEAVAAQPPALAVLDEAHALAKWGASFRPSYLYAARFIGDLRGSTGAPHLALFTASAGGDLARSILESVGAPGPVVEIPHTAREPPREWGSLIVRAPAVRENIRFAVAPAPEGPERARVVAEWVERLSRWAEEQSGGRPWLGIVFTGYVRSERRPWLNAESLAREIEERTGIAAVAYHGQLSSRERRAREDAIYEASRTGRGPRVVVATKAFGMGVDIPNIRWIIHAAPSDSIEDYYQEAGRAGRDGQPSIALALYNPRDFEERRRLVRQQAIRPSQVLRAYNTLARLHREATAGRGGWTHIVLPLDPPWAPSLQKAVDALRGLGLADYWITRAELAAYRPGPGAEPWEALPWYMELPGGAIVGPRLDPAPPGWRELALEYEYCPRPGEQPYYPLRVRAGGAEVGAGQCGSWEPASWGRGVLVAVLSPEESHGEVEVLEPGLYARVARMSVLELEGLRALEEALAEAARAAEHRGPLSGEVDRIVKSHIERSLSSPPRLEPRQPPPGLLARLETCPSPGECARSAAEALARAYEWLGSMELLTLAAQEEGVEREVARLFEEATGEPFRGRRGAYRLVLERSRRGPWSLMDLGYIVVVARARQRTLEALSRLEPYPYRAVLLYSRPA